MNEGTNLFELFLERMIEQGFNPESKKDVKQMYEEFANFSINFAKEKLNKKIGDSKILMISVSSNLFSNGENITYSFKDPNNKEVNLLFSPDINDSNVFKFNYESNFMFCLFLEYVDDGKNDEIMLKFGEKNKKLNFKPVNKKCWMIKIEDENFFDNNEVTEVQKCDDDDFFIKKILDKFIKYAIEVSFIEMQKLERQFKEILKNWPALTSEQEKSMSDLESNLIIYQTFIRQFYYKKFTEQNLPVQSLNNCQIQIMKNKYLNQYTTENVMDENIRNQIAERVIRKDMYYIFFLVQSNLLDHEKEIRLSFYNNYYEDTLKLSKNVISSSCLRKFEYDNYIVFSIPVEIDSFKLTLTDLKSDKSKKMSVKLYDYFQFYQIKIEDENFFTDENKQGILEICENNLLLDNFFENIKNKFNKTYKEYIETCFRDIQGKKKGIEIKKLYTKIHDTYKQLIPSQNFTLQEIQDMQNSFVQKQNVIKTEGRENVPNTFEQDKSNLNPNGFGISAIVTFLLTLTFIILTFAAGLIPMLPGIITIAICGCSTIGLGITFAIFKKNESENKKTSKLEEVTLSPNNNNSNITNNIHEEEEEIPDRTNDSQDQSL